ncbi:hypothetical protein L600_002700000300 [Isoptericola variabilis J7]|nr:hypothetical protein L600_002700000300 [Isoptericola variabilis J7]
MTEDPTLHRLMSARPGLIHAASVVQDGPVMPNQPSTSLTSPYCPLNSSRSSTPTATGGVILGMKNAVRKNPADRPAWLSSSASARATTT